MTTPSQGISPLRQRMMDDMRMRRLAPTTQANYLRVVRQFTVFLGRSPDTATAEDIRRFQIQLSELRIRVERGKGGRYRHAMLSPDLLTLLRA